MISKRERFISLDVFLLSPGTDLPPLYCPVITH